MELRGKEKEKKEREGRRGGERVKARGIEERKTSFAEQEDKRVSGRGDGRRGMGEARERELAGRGEERWGREGRKDILSFVFERNDGG